MQHLLNQFKALANEEKLAFMKEAMPYMAEIFAKDLQKTPAQKPEQSLFQFQRKLGIDLFLRNYYEIVQRIS